MCVFGVCALVCVDVCVCYLATLGIYVSLNLLPYYLKRT